MNIQFNTKISVVFLSILFLTACGNKDAENKELPAETAITQGENKSANLKQITFTKDQYNLASIETGQIEMRNLSNIVKLNGVIDVEPRSMATVSAPLGGYLKTAGLLPGEAVKKGQVLATIENPEFIKIQQDYLESLGKLQFLEEEYKRQEKLRVEDINSAKTFQQVKSDYKVMQARIKGFEQQLALAGINKSSAQNGNITRTANLYAPITGFIKVSNKNIGDYVNPQDVIFEIVNGERIVENWASVYVIPFEMTNNGKMKVLLGQKLPTAYWFHRCFQWKTGWEEVTVSVLSSISSDKHVAEKEEEGNMSSRYKDEKIYVFPRGYRFKVKGGQYISIGGNREKYYNTRVKDIAYGNFYEDTGISIDASSSDIQDEYYLFGQSGDQTFYYLFVKLQQGALESMVEKHTNYVLPKDNRFRDLIVQNNHLGSIKRSSFDEQQSPASLNSGLSRLEIFELHEAISNLPVDADWTKAALSHLEHEVLL